MKKSKFILIAPISFVLVFSLVLSLMANQSETDLPSSPTKIVLQDNGCPEEGQIRGKVVYFQAQTCSMQYLQNSEVKLKGKNSDIKKEVKTDEDGYFGFNGLTEDKYKIIAKKDDFKKDSVKIKLREGRIRHVELELLED